MTEAGLSLEYTADEWCPSCGSPAFSLDEETGWCAKCTKVSSTTRCSSCGGYNEGTGWLCQHCKLEHFLSSNADRIEHHMNMGLSLSATLQRVRDEVRPTCIVCQKQIHHAKRGAIFCRRNEICRRYSRRYVYLYTERGNTKAEALAAILSVL